MIIGLFAFGQQKQFNIESKDDGEGPAAKKLATDKKMAEKKKLMKERKRALKRL